MKLSRILSFGSLIYLIVFVIDWIGTLFTLGDTNEVVESFLGVKIEQTITPHVLDLQTYLLPRALISYIVFLIVLTLIYYIVKRLQGN